MSSWADPFRERLQLLTDLLPVVAREPRFALKGGTAINLFEHDLPRLSVDVDLTWLLVADFAEDRRAITAALDALAQQLRASPLRLHVVAHQCQQPVHQCADIGGFGIERPRAVNEIEGPRALAQRFTASMQFNVRLLEL